MTENALKCKFNGGNPTVGYLIDSEQHFQIDPVKAPFVLNAFKMYDEGSTMCGESGRGRNRTVHRYAYTMTNWLLPSTTRRVRKLSRWMT